MPSESEPGQKSNLLGDSKRGRKRDPGEKGQGGRHEGVSEFTEMSAVFHLFSENIRRITRSFDVVNSQCLVLNPFPKTAFSRISIWRVCFMVML